MVEVSGPQACIDPRRRRGDASGIARSHVELGQVVIQKHAPLLHSIFDRDWRGYFHNRKRITATATIKTAILKRCMARARVRQCCPNRYPALAMQVTQSAAPRKLKRANARQRMRSTPASGPPKTRRPKMKRGKKPAAAP